MPLVNDDGFRAAAGATLDEFSRFQVGLLSLCEFATELALALQERWRLNPTPSIEAEFLEWTTLFWKEEPLLRILGAMTRLNPKVIERLVESFSLDYRSG